MVINVDDNNQTKIIIIAIRSTDFVLYWWPHPNIFPVPLATSLKGGNKKNRPFLKRFIQSVFCQIYSSRTSYHDRTYWLQYRIKLVTWVPVEFQQKNSLTINDWLEPQIVLWLSAHTRYVKLCLYCVVSYFLIWKSTKTR